MALFEWIDRHRVIAISAGNAAVLITAITVAALRSDAGIAAAFAAPPVLDAGTESMRAGGDTGDRDADLRSRAVPAERPAPRPAPAARHRATEDRAEPVRASRGDAAPAVTAPPAAQEPPSTRPRTLRVPSSREATAHSTLTRSAAERP